MKQNKKYKLLRVCSTDWKSSFNSSVLSTYSELATHMVYLMQ